MNLLSRPEELKDQIIASVPFVKTEPIEYARQLRKLLSNHGYTIDTLAQAIGKPIEWVEEKLALLE